MYRILARQRASARASALSNGSIKDSRPVAGSDQGVDAPVAKPRYALDRATWYAALSGHNDGDQGDCVVGEGADATSFDLDLLDEEALAA